MTKSFYHYALKFRGSKKFEDFHQFAEDIYNDHDFPKHSTNYSEISRYLEESDGSIDRISTFDRLWETYVYNE